MEPKFAEVAQRIIDLREIMELSVEEMAQATDTTVEEYVELEKGKTDFSFTFLYKCAERFGVDMIELLTGENPRLKSYTITRNGKGLPIKRRQGFAYYHLAEALKDKLCEPFLVCAPYLEEQQTQSIHLSQHDGQEFNYILSGKLKVQIGDNIEILNPGDSVMYDSSQPHGMIATDGEECRFLAIILKD
ncbi:MAG: cupin domain-containing protein [Clostridia bacterium]|nr:cupin domain-containing protein [Clostridia bacterium]